MSYHDRPIAPTGSRKPALPPGACAQRAELFSEEVAELIEAYLAAEDAQAEDRELEIAQLERETDGDGLRTGHSRNEVFRELPEHERSTRARKEKRGRLVLPTAGKALRVCARGADGRCIPPGADAPV